MSASDGPTGGGIERWARVEAIFSAALERESGERAAFLDEACAGDPTLRREVDQLFEAHYAPGLFDEAVRRADAASAASGPGGETRSEGSDVPHAVGARLGAYEVDGVLGRGGMGVVYAAHRADGEFEQEVALKVLPAGTTSSRLQDRFRRERQILARLSHPNIARLLDGGVDDRGRPWFAMERIRGRPLLEYSDDCRLGLRARIDLFLTVCDAVQHAHQGLVVHRDLKPGNVLVDADGTPKLLDFGIAKLLDPDAVGPDALETRMGIRVLTPAYAAPEQLRGEPAHTASDIYQLGILLYELLTGVHPFPERTRGRSHDAEGATHAHPAGEAGAHTRPTSGSRRPGSSPLRPSAATSTEEQARTRSSTPRALRQRLKGDLDAIVLKALREEPERRYHSAVELADDLRRHRARRPVRARPDGWAYRANRFVRRNAVTLGAGAVLLAGAAAFTAGVARESRRTALQRDRAQAVSDFLQELFAGASPYASAGEEVTARDLLDRGAERIRAQLGDQPVIRATLMDVIGDAYWELGLTTEGRSLKEEALEVWRAQAAVRPELRPSLVRSLARTARYRVQEAELDASRPLLEEAEAGLPALPEDANRARAGVQNDLGMAWQAHGEYDRAEPLLEAAVEGFRSTPGSDLRAAASMGNLGWLRIERSDPDSAEALFRGALAMRREALGPDHLFVANTLEGLGNLYVRTGRLAEAESAYRESLRIRTVGLPEDHYLIHASALGLARVLGRSAEPDPETDALFRSAIDGVSRSLGAASAPAAFAHNEYAIFLRDHGRTGEAVAEFTRAEEAYREVFGDGHLNPALVGANRAWALHLDGRSREAVAAFAGVLPVIEAAYDGGIPYLENRQDYGIALCAVPGGQAEAMVHLREVVEGVEAALPGDDRILEARNALAQCLERARRLDEAENLLLGVLESTAERPSDDPYRSFATGALIRVYEAQGRSDEADRLRTGG